ncbi:MAG: hypothetical protein WA705_30440 [Candidatus Ozemobacteraceae bacterium]
MVEILLTAGLVVVLIGWLVIILNQFQRGFLKGEESGVILYEASSFLSNLRYDLINAVGPKDATQDDWKQYVKITPENISFTVFTDTDGNIEPVEYVFEKNQEGGTIQRFQAKQRRMLIDHHVVSLAWDVGNDLVHPPGIASGYRQIWVSVRLSVGGRMKSGGKSREITIETKVFPTRLNQQLNFHEGISDPVGLLDK